MRMINDILFENFFGHRIEYMYGTSSADPDTVRNSPGIMVSDDIVLWVNADGKWIRMWLSAIEDVEIRLNAVSSEEELFSVLDELKS